MTNEPQLKRGVKGSQDTVTDGHIMLRFVAPSSALLSFFPLLLCSTLTVNTASMCMLFAVNLCAVYSMCNKAHAFAYNYDKVSYFVALIVTGKSSVTKTLFRINAQQSHTNISYFAKTESIQHAN